MRPIAILSLAAAAALGLSACGSASTGSVAGSAPSAAATVSGPATPSASPAAAAPATGAAAAPAIGAAAPGAYLTKAQFQDQKASREGTKVVYYFHADWCPSCRATEASIDAEGLPAGLTLVKVDFDTDTDLRKQYGITQQHTFVQVDPGGTELAKWTGTISGADIEAKTV